MRTILAGLILLVSVASWAGDKVQPLNIKVGLWESNTSTKTSGAMPIPDDVLAKLSPEQRAKIEERMKSGGETHNSTRKHCVTKEDLEKGADFDQEKGECTRNVVESTSSKLVVRYSCHGQEMEGSGNLSIEALSPENVRGVADSTMNAGGRTMKAHTTFTSKWVGGTCSKDSTH